MTGPADILPVPPATARNSATEADPATTARTCPADSSLDQAVSLFVELRPRLFGIAYRLLGSAAEAEDVVQDVWVRWQKTDRSVVLSPTAFLSSATTRLAINVAQSARVRRETYIGPWLPEPIDTSCDPEAGAQRAEALETALLIVMEKLSPTERAAYVLREAFDYAYPDIADLLRLSVVNARKIVSRARKHLTSEERTPVDPAEHRQLLTAFISATQSGNITPLETLLTPQPAPPQPAPPRTTTPRTTTRTTHVLVLGPPRTTTHH